MTEYEKLKQNADQQYIAERYEEIGIYLDNLYEEITALVKKRKTHFKYELAVAVIWIGTALLDLELLWMIFLFVWLFVTWRGMVKLTIPIVKLIGKADGAIDILRILGMASPKEDDTNKKKKSTKQKVSLYEKMWNAIKSKKRQEAIA